jgi:hypothetical protein
MDFLSCGMTTRSAESAPHFETDSTIDLGGRNAEQLLGSLRCFDRVIMHGTLYDVAHPGALLVSMQAAGFKPRDLARFARPITSKVRDHIIGLARQQGIAIEMVTRKNFRQEDRVAEILKARGTHPGLVHIFAVKESANVFDTRHAREDGYAQVIVRRGACIHYYLYWLDPMLGLIHVRVPTWLPLRLQVYFNGHSWLANQLKAAGISYELADNALSQCGDWQRAQQLADSMDPRQLHDKLKELTQVCCPATSQFPNGYYWCLTQVEYAQDLVFKDQATMDQLFEELARQALLTIKVQDVARFLGKRVPLGQDTQVNSHLGRRYAGLRLKHSFGPASVKLYNKPGGILRLEMTTYDVSFFKHYRQVVHQDGTQEQCLATMKKSLYSLRDLAQLMQAGVKRYSQWLASLREHTAAQQDVQRLGRPAHDQQGRSYRGFNPFLNEDEQVLQTLLRGEHALAGLTARRLRSVLEGWSRGQISRLLKRFRLHGLLRKIGHTYTYHLTPLARRVVTAVLDIKNNMMVPELAAAAVKN